MGAAAHHVLDWRTSCSPHDDDRGIVVHSLPLVWRFLVHPDALQASDEHRVAKPTACSGRAVSLLAVLHVLRTARNMFHSSSSIDFEMVPKQSGRDGGNNGYDTNSKFGKSLIRLPMLLPHCSMHSELLVTVATFHKIRYRLSC
jgi:hypothetical protein